MTRTACGERKVLGIDGNSYDATCAKPAGHAGRHAVTSTTDRPDESLIMEWDEANAYFLIQRAVSDPGRQVEDVHDLRDLVLKGKL